MSVALVLQAVEIFRSYGVPVTFEPGWETRGNGQSSAYQGGIVHHTGGGYNATCPGILIYGRSDLSGPLCNFAGLTGGGIHVVAAHPANHAGASGGPSNGPFPVTSLFNRLVWGLEICYPGAQPMTNEQYRTALVFAEVNRRLFGDVERCRAHGETSREGKWDPGYAPGATISMGVFRSDALNISEGDMSAQAEEWLRQIYGSMEKMALQRGIDIGDAFVSMFDSLKPVAVETGPKGADGKTPTYMVRPNEAAANVYAMTFFGSNYGFGKAIVKQLAEATGGTIDVDEEKIAALVSDSLAPAIAQGVVEVAVPAILQVIGKDNKDQAQAVIDLIHQKLGGAA